MSVGMYKVKPFYDSTASVELPTNMYKVKNFHSSTETPPVIDVSSMDPVTALEAKQEAILSKLASLRSTLDSLKGHYEVSETVQTMPVSSTSPGAGARSVDTSQAQTKPQTTVNTALGEVIHDMVINVDPSSPPLSLFVLFEMLKERFTVLATTYVHSSVSSIDPQMRDVIKNGSQVTRGNHQLALSVVWKKVENGPELVVSPAKQSVIRGEINIARYINRLLCPGWDMEDIAMATTIDEWLDTADLQLLKGNSKARNAVVKNLNQTLKKSDWLVGNGFSLVDLIMWSALNQSQLASSAPENVQKWLQACGNLTCFRSAVKFV